MITRIPKMLTANKRKLTETFDFVHNVMSIPHHIIVKFPQVMPLTALSVSAAIALHSELLSSCMVLYTGKSLQLSGHKCTFPEEKSVISLFPWSFYLVLVLFVGIRQNKSNVVSLMFFST